MHQCMTGGLATTSMSIVKSNEIFADSVRSTGDLAGVFEYDGEAGYFYLCQVKDAGRVKIIDALQIVSGAINFAFEDISILWDHSDTKVALFIKKVMWAIFDSKSGQKFGGGYRANGSPNIPPSIAFIKSSH